MSYFLEIWIRGFAKDYAKNISPKKEETYHPNITFVRPFLKTLKSEEEIKEKIVTICSNKNPIKFILEGNGNFDEKFYYIKIKDNSFLQEFDYELEKGLENYVVFFEKLDKKKNFHLSLNTDVPIETNEIIEQYMLRLTVIKDKKIWFSYDLVTYKTLNREESLDKIMWYNTVHEFTNKYNLLPTRNGYKPIK